MRMILNLLTPLRKGARRCRGAFVAIVALAGLMAVAMPAAAQSCGGYHNLEASPCLSWHDPVQPNTTIEVDYTVFQGVYGYYGLTDVEASIYNSTGTAITGCDISDPYLYVDANPVYFSMTCTTGSAPAEGANTFGTAQVLMWNGSYLLNGYNVMYARVYNGFTTALGNPSANLHQRAVCASNCFGQIFTHTTAPFYTLDTPHSITLVYDSDRHKPMPIIAADVSLDAMGQSRWLTSLSMNVTFTGGASLGTTTQGSGGEYNAPVRIAKQVDLSSYGTGAYPITITITAGFSVYTGDSVVHRTFSRSYNTRLLVVNDAASPMGPGWSVAGLQRLYFPSGGGYLLAENGGPAEYFSALGAGDSTNFTTLSYNSTTQQYTRTYRDSSKIVFNSSGQMLFTTNRYGLKDSVSWVAAGQPQEIREAMRVSASQNTLYHRFDYTSTNFTVTEKDNSTSYRQTTYAQDGSKNITSITDPDGGHTNFTYSSTYGGRMASITSRAGGTRKLTYNSYGRVTVDSLPSVPISNGSGGTTTGYPVTSAIPGVTLGMGSAMILRDTAYTKITDPLGYVWSSTTDIWGQPLVARDPSGATTTMTWGGVLQPTAITYSTSGTEWFEYSGDFMTAHHYPDSSVVRYHYGPFAQVDSTWGDRVVPTRSFISTSTGNVDSVKTATATGGRATARFTYDAYGRILSATDAGNHVTTVHYRADNGSADTTRAVGILRSATLFDVYGRDTLLTGAGLPLTRTHYDLLNRVTAVYDGVNATPTNFSYDNTGLRGVRNPKGELADSAAYNVLGWKTAQYDTYDSTKAVTYRYDRKGQLTSWTNRRGQVVYIAYDSLGRVLSKVGTNTTGGAFTYDPYGWWTKAWNANDTVTVFQNAQSVVDSVVTKFGSQRFRVTHTTPVHWTSNATVSIGTSGPSFNSRTFRRNAYTGVADSILASSGSLAYSYNSEGARAGITYGGGTSRTETYTAAHARQEGTFSNSTLADTFRRQYQFDVLGHVTQQNAVSSSGSSVTQKLFQYDSLGRLTSVQLRNSCGSGSADSVYGYTYFCSTVSTQSYTYDATGNRTDLSGSYARGNRLTYFNGYSFEHDADGNVTHKYNSGRTVNTGYEWSAENLLLKVTDSTTGASVQFDYDAYGQLVRRRTSGTVDRYWWWDGGEILGEMDGSFNKVAEYVYAGTDAPVMELSSSPVYQVLDELANVIGVHNGSSTVGQQIDYDAWGVPTTSGSAANTLRWKGLHYESGTAIGGSGLYYVRARWYDPALGRFLSEDPVGIAGGLNRYVFGGNDPINRMDPSGNCDVSDLEEDWVKKPYEIVDKGVIFQDANTKRWYCTDPDKNGAWVSTFLPPTQNPVLLPPHGGESDPFAIATGGAALGFGIVEVTGNGATLGTNLQRYASGWGGNQYVSTVGIETLGKLGGKAAFAVGVGLDMWQVYKGNESPQKAAVNTGVGATAVYLGGWPGLALGTVYSGVDLFYPGGWPGLWQNGRGGPTTQQVLISGF